MANKQSHGSHYLVDAQLNMAERSEHSYATPKGAKSPMWAHFGFLLNEEGKRVNEKQVHCHHCQDDEKSFITYSGNTTNLRQHLEKWHPEVLASISSARRSLDTTKQLTLEELTPKKLSPTSKRASQITRALASFVAKDMRPIALVEGEGFQSFMAVTEPSYVVKQS